MTTKATWLHVLSCAWLPDNYVLLPPLIGSVISGLFLFCSDWLKQYGTTPAIKNLLFENLLG